MCEGHAPLIPPYTNLIAFTQHDGPINLEKLGCIESQIAFGFIFVFKEKRKKSVDFGLSKSQFVSYGGELADVEGSARSRDDSSNFLHTKTLSGLLSVVFRWHFHTQFPFSTIPSSCMGSQILCLLNINLRKLSNIFLKQCFFHFDYPIFVKTWQLFEQVQSDLPTFSSKI